VRSILLLLAAAALAWTFLESDGWLQLCAGLAMFLFGMQCLEEGLRQLAGGRLEQWLAHSTGTPLRGLLFGIGGTMLLQSSTLVSLLTIAFISSGLIQLAGGISIIFGANLGATSGIWLLALAGHGFSLSPLALPLLVFGVLAGFNGPRSKAAGRVVLGVAFIFLGIDQIKAGFDVVGGAMDLSAAHPGGARGVLLFAAIGMAATVVLQSSHATLMLILAALAAGQVTLDQSLALAVGSNVGSSVSTGVMGALGGNRSGQRLALAHVLFNVVTALLALALLVPLSWMVQTVGAWLGFGDNALLQLALFHTLFNATGVALFWPWQGQLATWLRAWLPDPAAPTLLVDVETVAPLPEDQPLPERARHLSEQALESVDAAAAAVALELHHLGRRCLEVIAQALCLPAEQLVAETPDLALLDARPQADGVDADVLYQRHVKGIYGDLLAFMGRMTLPLDAAHQRFWMHEQMAALQLVNAVKDAKHLQKNLRQRLREDDSPLRDAYLSLRRHLFGMLRNFLALGALRDDDQAWRERLEDMDRHAAAFDAGFRQRVFAALGRGEVDGWQAGSLMNDMGYAERIQRSLREAAAFVEEPASLRRLRRIVRDNEPAAIAADAG